MDEENYDIDPYMFDHLILRIFPLGSTDKRTGKELEKNNVK